MQGRPLRFLGLIAGGWVTWRVALLSGAPLPTVPIMPDLIAPPMLIARAEAASAPQPWQPLPIIAAPAAAAPPPVTRTAPDRRRVNLALAALVGFGGRFTADNVALAPVASVTVPATAQPVAMTGRPGTGWSASAWLLTRPGGGVPGAAQLGGGQAGFVVRRTLDASGDLSAYGRVTAPLEGEGRELAFGLDWQPFEAPVRLVAERRFGLDDQPGGPAIGTVAGIGPTPITSRATVEAYGQAGVILRDEEAEPYGDAFVRVARPVTRIDDARLDLGIGAWGAAQQDAQRLDIGPSIGATLPIAGQTWRASLDWRERVAGDAQPLSGPALTIAADF